MERSSAEKLFAAIATYVAENDSFVTKTKLLKLVYLFDVEFYRIHRETFTGFNWKFFHLGPWTPEFDPLLASVITSGVLTEHYGKYDTPFLRAPSKVYPSAVLPNVRDEIILRSILKTWGAAQTNEILDKAYFGTEPMLTAIRNEPLDFSAVPMQQIGSYSRTSSGADPIQISKLRAQFEAKHRKTATQILTPPPSYDAAYESAIKVLDSDEDY